MCFPDLFQCNDAMRPDPKDRVRITTKHWDIEHIEHIERTRRLDVAGISAGSRPELQTPSACVSYHSYTTAIPQLPLTRQELRALRQEVRRRFRMGHGGAATTTTVRLLQIVTDRLQIVSSLALCHLPESNGKQQA